MSSYRWQLRRCIRRRRTGLALGQTSCMIGGFWATLMCCVFGRTGQQGTSVVPTCRTIAHSHSRRREQEGPERCRVRPICLCLSLIKVLLAFILRVVKTWVRNGHLHPCPARAPGMVDIGRETQSRRAIRGYAGSVHQVSNGSSRLCRRGHFRPYECGGRMGGFDCHCSGVFLVIVAIGLFISHSVRLSIGAQTMRQL